MFVRSDDLQPEFKWLRAAVTDPKLDKKKHICVQAQGLDRLEAFLEANHNRLLPLIKAAIEHDGFSVLPRNGPPRVGPAIDLRSTLLFNVVTCLVRQILH